MTPVPLVSPDWRFDIGHGSPRKAKAHAIEIRSPHGCTIFESWLQITTPSILLVPMTIENGSDSSPKGGHPGNGTRKEMQNGGSILDEEDHTEHSEKVLRRTATIEKKN